MLDIDIEHNFNLNAYVIQTNASIIIAASRFFLVL